jgi:hypothetical protein
MRILQFNQPPTEESINKLKNLPAKSRLSEIIEYLDKSDDVDIDTLSELKLDLKSILDASKTNQLMKKSDTIWLPPMTSIERNDLQLREREEVINLAITFRRDYLLEEILN